MTPLEENTRASFLLSWLEKPYYFNSSLTFRLSVSLGIGIFTGLFIYILTPLEIDKVTQNLTLYSVVCTIIVTSILLCYFFLITRVFPGYFNNKHWTIGRHIFTVLFLMISCITVFWIYNRFLSGDRLLMVLNYSDVTRYTLKIGMFPLLLYLFIDERYGRYETTKVINKIKESNKQYEKEKIDSTNDVKPLSQLITIHSYNLKDAITFDVSKLLYITSETNYACFFVYEKNSVNEYIIRKSLTAIESDLKSYSYIVRCHKSYFVNSKYIKNIRGNSRGYYLNINFREEEIPVSRKFTKEDLELLIA